MRESAVGGLPDDSPVIGSARARRRAGASIWLVLWAGVGVLATVGLFGVYTIGPVALLAACAGGAALAAFKPARCCVSGLLFGPGVVFLVTAWHDRDGPNWSCTQAATPVGNAISIGQVCHETPSPLPELAIGLVLVAAGVLGTLLSFRARPST